MGTVLIQGTAVLWLFMRMETTLVAFSYYRDATRIRKVENAMGTAKRKGKKSVS